MGWWLRLVSSLLGRRDFQAGERGGRGRGRVPKDRGPNVAVRRAAPLTRGRARDLCENSPHGKRALGVVARHLVGTGIVPRPRLGERADNKRVSALWKDFARECQVEHDLDIYGLQRLAVQGLFRDGEVLIRRRPRRPEDGLRVPLQLQLLEADFLDAGKNASLANGGRIVQGVEFDVVGRRSAYWLFRSHPKEALLPGPSVRVPASEVIHLYDATRSGTVRGMPWLHADVLHLGDIDEFRGAEIIRKKTEASMVGMVEDMHPEADAAMYGDPGVAGGEGQADASGKYVTDSRGVIQERVTPGSFVYLPPGRKIDWSRPTAIGGYREYVATELRAVAAGAEVPYELLTGDLTGVNFSSARVGLSDFRLWCETVQWLILIPLMCDRIWAWFTEAAYVAGELAVPRVPVEHAPPRYPSINPVQDRTERLMAMRMGATSLSRVVAEEGYDLPDLLEEIVEDNKLLAQYGLVFEGDPSKFAKSGALQAGLDASKVADTDTSTAPAS